MNVGILSSARLVHPQGSGYGSGNQIMLEDLYEDRVNVLRDGTAYEFTINAPKNYFTTWAIVESSTNTIVNLGSGLTIDFTADFDLETVEGYSALPAGKKFYDIVVLSTRHGNNWKRQPRRAICVYPAVPVSYDETWTSGGAGYHDGAGTDRPDYKIHVTGTYNGTGYLGMEQWRSTDPARPIHIVFDNVSFTTTNAYMIRVNFDCQNIILDGCADPDIQYGFVGNWSGGSKAQAFMIEPVDPGAGSTIGTAGKNITVSGIRMNCGGFGAGFNIQMDKTAHASFSDNWTFDNCSIFNTMAYNTGDEAYYLDHFNDSAITGGLRASKLTNLIFCYNNADTIGNDGFQIGLANNSEIHNNYCVNIGTKDTAAHRNMLQLIAAKNTYVYRNYFDNRAGGTCNSFNIATGETGGDVHIWANLFVNLNTSAHTNGFTNIQENQIDDVIEFNFYNNTFISHFENSFEWWNATLSPTINTYFNPLRSVDNVVVNLNDADQNFYMNSPNQTYYTISNYFTQSSSSPGFANYAGGDYKPSSLSAAMFGSRTSFTKQHVCGNQDFEGYEFVSDIRGCYSGVPLQIQDTL